MKAGFFLVIASLLFFALGTELFALGKKETEKPKEPIDKTWILCITEFDSSTMSPSWQTAGDTVTRSLAGALQNLDFRFRQDEETAYYGSYALAKSTSQAADNIAKKRAERDLLIFRGDPEWKYQRDLKTVETAILKLEEDMAKVEPPLVEEKPAFAISEKNKNGTFPPPPKAGRENRFCTDEKADSFLTGSLSEYYGRIYLELRMYNRYSASYAFVDNILFSSEDFSQAISEVSQRLSAAVSVLLPSAVIVHAIPPESMILLDGSYIGQGEIGMRSHSPGSAEIAVHADNHEGIFLPLELNPGELAELFIDLTPLGSSVFQAENPPGSKVFLGSLYVGETPLTLELPRNQFSYISVETVEGEIGSAIVRDSNLVKGSAQFVIKDEGRGSADFLTSVPVSKEEQRVEKTRKGFYTSYGAFWFVLPAALLTGGIAGNYIASNDYVNANNLYAYDSETRDRIAANALRSNIIRTGSYGAIVASLGITFFQIFRYLYVSGGDSTPIVKVKPRVETEQ
jgi:hypothetical protein